jgi:glycine C-acetyltransferase
VTPDPYLAHLRGTLDRIRADGFYKTERIIRTPQMPALRSRRGASGRQLLRQQLSWPRGRRRARRGREERASIVTATAWRRCASSAARRACTASSRPALAAFLDTGDAILYSSCFDANGGLFETLLAEEDAVISDELNHASIVDGIRLCKARRYRYRNNDMGDLAPGCRKRTPPGARSS